LRDHLRGSGGQEPYKLVDPAIFLIGDDWREVFADAPPPSEETLPTIDRADLVLAYFSKVDALASVEIGWAAARDKPVSIGFSDDLSGKDYRELWLVRLLATRVYFGSPAMVWRDFEDDWIMTR